jgi:transcriptional regulator with XRE-family HTH domain
VLFRSLRVERKRKKMTLEALSQKAGISGACISQIENGSRDGRVSSLRKLAKALGVKVGKLIDG